MSGNLEYLRNEKLNHFIQIQKIVSAISEDKDLLNQFDELKEFATRYEYTLDICEKIGLEPLYSLEEYTQFQIYTNLFYEIGKNEQTSKEFSNLKTLDEIFRYVENIMKNSNLSSYYDKNSFEQFLFSMSYNKKLISEEELDMVAAGTSDSEPVMEFLGAIATTQRIVNQGYGLGQFARMWVTLFRVIRSM